MIGKNRIMPHHNLRPSDVRCEFSIFKNLVIDEESRARDTAAPSCSFILHILAVNLLTLSPILIGCSVNLHIKCATIVRVTVVTCGRCNAISFVHWHRGRTLTGCSLNSKTLSHKCYPSFRNLTYSVYV